MSGQGFDVVARGYDRAQVDHFLWRLTLPTERLPDPDFKVAFRGYDRDQVDAYVREALSDRRARQSAGTMPPPPRPPVQEPRPPVQEPRREPVPAQEIPERHVGHWDYAGYADHPDHQDHADHAEPADGIDGLAALFEDGPPVVFDVAFRGYDRRQVDAYVTTVLAGAPDEPAPRLPPIFDLVFRGYDRDQVDQFVQDHRGRQSHGGSYGRPGT